MLQWSKLFETKIELVDTQHKKLFTMVNEILAEISRGEQSAEALEEALAELLEYAALHFKDEETIMASYQLDEQFLRMHKMEHNSFVYDIDRLRNHLSVDEDLFDRFEKLLKFITSWLIYHTLRTDQVMAMQVQAIERGKSPEEAYTIAQHTSLNPAITQMVLDAVLHIWAETAERVLVLERLLTEERSHPKERLKEE